MPIIAEILAPSGTGKTTLYKKLQKKWKPQYKWAVYHDFRYQRRVLYTFPKDYFLVIKRKADILKNVLFSSEIQYKQNSVHQVPNEKLFYQNHTEFCDAVMKLISEHSAVGFNSEDKRVLNTYFFFETIEHLQAVMNHTEDERLCIMDEGLLSRLMHLNSPSFRENDVKKYMKHIPVPPVVFYLKCAPEIIAERIDSREKIATVHSSLTIDDILKTTRETQQLMELTLDFAKKKGSEIIEVNAEATADDMAVYIFERIDEIAKS